MSHSCIITVLFPILIIYSAGYKIQHTGQNGNHEMFHQNLKHLFGRSTRSSPGNICCAYGQWEANAYIIASTKLTLENITMIVYYNGTGKIAFDETNKKSYIRFNVTEFAPGSTKHDYKTSTDIKDFATGITYDIDGDSCFKQPNSADMQIVCVPGNATVMSKGLFNGVDVTTYQISYSAPPLEILTTPTVRQNGSNCETIMFSYAMFSDDTIEESVYDVDVVDITPGIKDPSIFVPPKDCN